MLSQTGKTRLPQASERETSGLRPFGEDGGYHAKPEVGGNRAPDIKGRGLREALQLHTEEDLKE